MVCKYFIGVCPWDQCSCDGANLEEAMHKSKLAGFIIDCQTDDLERAADFWGGALGMPVRELSADEAALYKRLEDSRVGAGAGHHLRPECGLSVTTLRHI